MCIQVGGVGDTEYDLLVKPVGDQVTKLIYSPIMTRLICVGQNTDSSYSQPVGSQTK